MGQEEPVVWVEDRDDDRRIGAGKVLTSADGAECGETAAAALGTGAITTLVVNEAITNWPETGLFLIDSEVFSYTGKANSTKTFTGVSRAARGVNRRGRHSAGG